MPRTATAYREEVQQVNISESERREHRSLTQEPLRVPKISAYNLLGGGSSDVCLVNIGETWMTPYRHYLANGLLPQEPTEAKIFKKNTCKYTLVDGKLFRHGYNHPICHVWAVSSAHASWLSSMKVSVGVTSVDELSYQKLFEQGTTGRPWGRTARGMHSGANNVNSTPIGIMRP